MEADSHAVAQALEFSSGFITTSSVMCAVELSILDILESRGSPVSLSDLYSAVDCPPHRLHRLMRFLSHHRIVKKTRTDNDNPLSVEYSPTLVSRHMTRAQLGPYFLIQNWRLGPNNPIMTAETLRFGKSCAASKYEEQVPLFVEAMWCHAKLMMSAIIKNYSDGFRGVGSVVDVGGCNGMAIATLVKAFPWIRRGVCFDLPNVVNEASPLDGIEFVGGNMFECIPKADVVSIMRVLHNWDDENCIKILKKCKEAIPPIGKVVIVDAVIDEEEEDEFTGARLAIDMTMLSVFVDGKERTYKEWDYIIKGAGFSSFVVNNIKTVESIIEAYP